MKTFVVLAEQDRQVRDFMGNAETPEEIVLYAIARAGLLAETYVVYDHDLNRFEVPRPSPQPDAA